MRLQRLTPGFVLLLLVSLVAPTGLDRAEAGETSRHFQGTAEGAVTEIISPTEFVLEYVGYATHLGAFTRQETLSLTESGSITGTVVFVAANGDELYADVEGQFISPTDAVGTYTFTGGTGRFSEATGTADFTVSAPDFGHVSVAFKGTIDY